MRALAWIVLVLWLAGNVRSFWNGGRERVRGDVRIAALRVPARQRAALWGSDVGKQLLALESVARDLREEGHEKVLLVVSSTGSNPYVALATHLLYPTHVVVERPRGRKLAAMRRDARDQGCGAVLWWDGSLGWSTRPAEQP